MTRVAHVVLCSGHGGDALAALLVAKAQRARGDDAVVYIGAAEHSGTFVERARSNGVPAEVLAGVPSRASGSVLRRILHIWRSMSSVHGDVLHVHTGDLVVRTADVAGVNLLRFGRRVATLQSPTDWSPYADAQVQMRRWRHACDGFGLLVVPSERSKRLQMAAGVDGSRIRIVGNPVDSSAFVRGAGAAIREELGLDASHFVVLYASRLDEDKRPADAIEAFARAHATRPHMRLLIAGNGSVEPQCRELVRDLELDGVVRLVGYRDDVPALLDASDAFVLLTRWESFGMAVAEAMTAGVAVVTTTAVEELGVVEHGRSALVVEVGDVDAAAQALGSYVDDPELRRRISAAGIERATLYDAGHVAQRLTHVYEEAPLKGTSLVRRAAVTTQIVTSGLLARIGEAAAQRLGTPREVVVSELADDPRG